MKDFRLGEIESRFADIIWKNEPLRSGKLAEIAQRELSWKRTTTYTVLKRLCDKGLFQNCDMVVTSVISRDEFYACQSEQYVEESFAGSLPAFLAAFGSRKKLSEKDIEEMQKLIDAMRE